MIQRNFVVFTASAFLFPIVFSTPSLIASQENSNKPSKTEVIQKTKKLQMPFIANNGQTDEKVKFYANTFGGTVFVTKDGEIVYSLPNNSSELGVRSLESDGRRQRTEARIQKGRGESHSPSGISPLKRGDKGVCKAAPTLNDMKETHPWPLLLEGRRGVVLKEQFVGAKIKTIKGEEKSVTNVNYFKGKDPSKWKTNISTYDIVSLGEVYGGIELKLKAYGSNVEKLFCVKPGADPEGIKIRLSGVKDCGAQNAECGIENPKSEFQNPKLQINKSGELVAETELGTVKFTKPIAYQEINGKRVDVSVEYRVVSSEAENKSSKHKTCNSKPMSTNPKSAIQNLSSTSIGDPQLEYGFKVASYDKTKELIIDPLLASTFLGGSSSDYGYSLVLDTSGNVYVAGYTYSSNFPTTSGAYDTSYNGGDVFVSKLNSGLTSLLSSTYLGWSSDDYGFSVALDTSGNVYVTGQAYSTDFPTMSGAYDTSLNGDSDAFVLKLNSGLTSLLASTYLGGSSSDYGNSPALDTSGNVYVAGSTYSTDFPTTSGAFDTSYNGGGSDGGDVFVSKLNSELTSLLTSTYLGGSSSDYGNSPALDTSGNVYVTGWTRSTDFPTTIGAYDTAGNGYDVFVSKLNGELTSLLASTFLGGSSSEEGKSLALDTSGIVYVTGYTYSTDFPTTSGAYDASGNLSSGGTGDAFVSKLNSGLTSLLASTFLGGSSDEIGYSLTLDTSGIVYVAGGTSSRDFPTTSGAYDTALDGNAGNYEVFVSKLDGGLTSLLASTYLGGSGNDKGSSLTLDTSGNVYVTGYTGYVDRAYTVSSDFPTTSGAYDTAYNGGTDDVFISKLDGNLSYPKPTATTGSATNVTSNSAKLNGTVNANNQSTAVWFDYGNTSGSYKNKSSTKTVTGSSNTTVSITVSGLSPATSYYYRIAAEGVAGTSYGDELSFTTLSDTTASNGSVIINSGDTYATSTIVTLTLSATDDVGVTGYNISENSTTPSALDPGWTPITSINSYSASVSYTLSIGDGNKTAYVWFKDASENVSNPVSDSIILDLTTPTINITSPTSGANYTTASSVIAIGGSASDSTSGVSSVIWSNDKGGNGTASGTTSWLTGSVSLILGENMITVTATDGAGNTGTDTITVTFSTSAVSTPTPTPSSSPTPILTPTTEPVKKCIISGYVIDKRGNPIESAKIRLKGINSKVLKKTTSDEDGLFEFTDLDADTYIITALKNKYKTVKQTITLEAGEEVDIEIVMKKIRRK